MRLGFLTVALENMSLDEKIDWAYDNGFDCIEVGCWPMENDRDYSTSDINVDTIDKAEADRINDHLKEKGLCISSLAYYDNNLHHDLTIRAFNNTHLKKVIDAAELLGVELVGTFIGRNSELSLTENFKEFEVVFRDILEYAKNKGIKLMIENCPMPAWDRDGLAGTISYSPELWDKMFSTLDYDNFGLNFDPSHLVWLGVDYIKAIRDYKDKIFHFHAKDTTCCKEELSYYSIFGKQFDRKDGFDLGWVHAKLPGNGDVDWAGVFEALKSIGYKGVVSIEHEDPDYEKDINLLKEGILIGKSNLEKYMKGV